MARPNTYPHKTSFPAGAGFLGDSDAGVFFMEKDPLLALTSQNTLAGVIPAFSPDTSYLQKQFCTKDGKIYRFKVDHSGTWSAGDVDLIADLTSEVVRVNGNVSAAAPYDNCNNFPANEIVSNFSTYANVSNLPSSEEFVVITLSNSSTGNSRIQYFFGRSNKMFVRNRFGTGAWSNWVEIGAAIICRGSVSSLVGSAPYNDLNTYPNNEIALVTTGYASVANKPIEESFSVITISNSATSTVKLQILNSQTNKVFIRCDYNGVWGSWNEIGSGIVCKGSVSSLVGSAPYNDLDTYPNNEVVLVTTNYASVSNKPTNEQFSVLTMSSSSSSTVKMQILNTLSNQTYIRSKFGGSWGSWAKIGIENPIVGAGSKGTATAPYDDLNTFPNNEVVINTATYSNVSNKPTDEAFNVATISNSSSSTAKFQILTSQYNRIFIRSAFGGTWGRWSRIDADTEFVGNPLMCYDNMLFIGDSLTWSAVFVDDIPSNCRQAKKTYPQMMAHICGTVQETLATAGDSASQSWARYNASLTSKTNALAVIYLGTNAGLTDTLDTDAPESDPYTDWANTNTGCYAKYVARLQELGYKILLVKPWVSSGTTLPDTKKVIGEIAERFGCAVVQAPVNSEFKYHYYPDLSGRNDVHYNDLGYSWFASALVEAVASLPEVGSSNSLKYIIPD